MTALHIDFETRSFVDLKKTGVYVYAEHSSTDLWCACYCLDDGPIETWRPGQPCPAEVLSHVLDGGRIYAHNANFERVIWKHILTPRYGWPEPDLRSWRCTMIMAYALALPGNLEDAAPAAGIEHRKDAAGRRLMLQMTKPRRKETPEQPALWWDASDKVERLIAYCKQDVEVERELSNRLRPLKESEQELWFLDQEINDRGLFVDVELCNAAKKIVADTAAKLDAEMSEATGHAVTGCSNRNQLIAFVREHGVETESIAKDQLEYLLSRPELPDIVRRVLTLRRESAKASVAKIDALLRGRSEDGYARGLLQFSAAGTGRWAGRRFQPQNIKRPDLEDVDEAIDLVLSGDAELVDMFYGEPLSFVGDCLRGMIRAAPGRKIVAADYSNIEGRVLAWLAGEQWKLDAFRAADAGTGHEIYKLTASKILGKAPSEITKSERQAYGKVPELALGYQGGVGAFQTMAVTYGVKVTDEEAETIRDEWRAEHPNTKQFWWDLEAAAIGAVERPGTTIHVRDLCFRVAGSFLFLRLPSKRFLAYAYPEIKPKLMPWTDDTYEPFESLEAAKDRHGYKVLGFDAEKGLARIQGPPVWKDSVSYMGVNSYTRKWERCFLYGGLLAENATQAVSRDIMADAMPRLEAADYPIILTVHDEIVAQPEIGHGSAEEMAAIMSTLPAWAEGCPVVAEGFEAERYRK